MKILVSGASGLVGSALVETLRGTGHAVTRLTRSRPAAEGAASWDPGRGLLEISALLGVEGVVHLAGHNLAASRWTQKTKALIRDSRIKGTRLMVDAMAKLQPPPRVLVCASAVGYYGSRGDEVLTESSSPGSGFLATLCKDWEGEAMAASRRQTRVVCLRFGVILSAGGGGLAKMLTPFRMGVGGVLGNGRQYMSWIGIEDAVNITLRALTDDSLSGPVNAGAPRPVTNREFTQTLGSVLSRPAILPMPGFVVRALFGEMADAVLLSSARVVPAKLIAAGHRFEHPELEGALKHLLARR